MIDCMAHLDDPRIEQPQIFLERAACAGVDVVLNAGFDPSTVPAPRFFEKNEGTRIYWAYGLHPQAIDHQRVTQQLDDLAQLLKRPRVVALGEIGLDHRPGMPPAGLQEQVFQTQLHLAQHLNLPVIIHCVRATGRLLQLLRDHGPLKSGGMLHAYGGPVELIGKFKALGLYFSFGSRVCVPEAAKCHRAAKKVPIGRLLVESDTPDHPLASDLASSEPAHVIKIVERLAQLRGCTATFLENETSANAECLFRFSAIRNVS
jgi:TatD DNase family protein